ncbi:MAG: DUF4402 domain-containing protein [Candidatus Marinimicrobia bacterium]|nr:DUF4402 domain-containing protein [Candidatus Neomarinimicrobiota bacterium]MCF7904395.1 DUF4402 domain-containing protein [Candidatus Neomarinimicrobiota bacterium]
MKKMVIITIVLTLGLSSGAFAQESATAVVDAVVQAALSIAKVSDVDFGNISATSTPIIDPTGVSHTDVNTPTVGEFTITGQSGAGVNITLTSATTTLGDGTNTMTFTADLKQHATTQASAIAISNPVTLGGSTHKLWLGGNLGTLTSQPSGTYASDNVTNGGGDIEVNVVYN